MKIEEMSPELRERAKSCASKEEALEFLSENQVELTAEQLEMISGGDYRGNTWSSFWQGFFEGIPLLDEIGEIIIKIRP